MRAAHIRNFCIIAHIDHGKSTLADRFLQRAKAIPERDFRDQVLDDMDLERERGITIKAHAVAIGHEQDGKTYVLNLIDTPGHVDFSYEVSRALAACEGAVLLVDAVQGVEAQTVANFWQALESDLTIIPVINKIDLPHARVEEVMEEMEHSLGVRPEDVILTSAKTGEGVEKVLRGIVERIEPPEGDATKLLRALVFDSVYDNYRGVVAYVRVMEGSVRAGEKVEFMRAGLSREVSEVGVFTPSRRPREELRAGEVGYLMANIRDPQEVKIGDTVTLARRPATEPLRGYRDPLPMVFCGLYPGEGTDATQLGSALEKLSLNDSAFTYQVENSEALGFGFRCGFLGPLHMEIVQERLERECVLEVVQTAPNVTYEVLLSDGEVVRIDNPARLPEPFRIVELREPVTRVTLIVPTETVGTLMKLAEERRGKFVSQEYLSVRRVMLVYDLPLAEIIFDFYDKLKSATKGYGTMDYEMRGYSAADLARLDVLVAGDRVDALSSIVHRADAAKRGRALVAKLRKTIARHLFDIPLQAAVGGKIVARETIRAMMKNVTAKCYGGDITRKRKLIERQREGKKRMKQIGRVSIPQEAFLAVLTRE
ncbi:MAG: translation elongation factor 4 [Planctomycetota bacterium]